MASESNSYPRRSQENGFFIEHYGSTVLGRVSTLGLGIVTNTLSARMLGPAGRGEYVAIIIWPQGIAVLFFLDINQAIAFNVAQRAVALSEVATAATTIGFIQSALSVIVGLLIVPHALANYSPTVQHLGIIVVLLTPVLIFSGYPANHERGKACSAYCLLATIGTAATPVPARLAYDTSDTKCSISTTRHFSPALRCLHPGWLDAYAGPDSLRNSITIS